MRRNLGYHAGMFLLTLFSSAATACPTIATGTPNPLSFDTAAVVIVREGTRTTFSVAINPVGQGQPFALVLPVPEVLEESEIRTLAPDIFRTLDAYSAPRHIASACGSESDADTDADSDTDTDADTDDTSVDVVAEYLVGDYQITILASDESRALGAWLDTNGYYMPDGAEPRLAEYIDAGSYFLAAKVAETAELADGTPLSPLQLSYESEIFSIPIRLATLNSPGEQDMVIYAITDEAEGRTGIANYPEFEMPEQCVWGDPAGDSFAQFYEGLFTEAWQDQGDAAWTVEFAGGPGDCNPCTATYPSPQDLVDLGFTGPYRDHHLTRLHLRYTPEQADQDLSLYGSGIDQPNVLSYADDVPGNDCIEAYCAYVPSADVEDDDEAPCGCDTGAPSGLFGVVAGLFAVRARRRAGITHRR